MHKELDKFYTKRSIVKDIISKVKFNNFDMVIEPSAGDGAFLEYIEHNNLIALDIHPENPSVKKQDWFKYDIPTDPDKVLIIGNPPFGINNKLSSKFLVHAFKHDNVDTIAFVLPNVYKKHTWQKYIPDNFYINEIVDLGRNAFEIDGKTHHVPCSFFIISKSDHIDLRQKTDIDSNDFEFSNKDDYDFFIFGAAPKKIVDEPTKNNRGYYIKSKNLDKQELIKRFKEVKWKGHSSANGGVYWLTKIDIIENYTKRWS